MVHLPINLGCSVINMDLQLNKNIMVISMIIWFVTAPLWINSKADEVVEQGESTS